MTADKYQRVKEVFLAVCDRAEAEQESAAQTLCGDDAELLAEVHSLLRAHRDALQHSAFNSATHQKTEPLVTQADAPDVSGDMAEVSPPTHNHPSPAASQVHTNRHTYTSHTGRTNHTGTGTHSGKGRFEPGAVLAERYRIVNLLGEGGMGEVYRAEDLVLDQVVALKFLPPSHGASPAWLERFHNEVRMSRQVTHPNVCRVFDIGEVDGEQFISMEFVDGEDLASLLRRIGRLPRDKALQIARQLCAGVAAAHDRGVLHRDLKPANVMIDGRGQVRITDFGISAPVTGSHDSAAGTPAYMAPEQFTKGEATIRSDIYSLGLVLYELFSGRQAFVAHSLPEYAKLHRQTSPTHPSTFIEDMDPLAERVIMRCLEKDAAKRPPSALAVSAALPGGDPLAAALAAGETPSPEMVAAAGQDTGISIQRGAILLGLTLIGLLLVTALAQRTYLLARFHDTMQPPAVLADRARTILSTAGYDQPLANHAQGFGLDDRYIAYVQATDRSVARWQQLSLARPGPVFFWWRESPKYVVSRDDNAGMITLDDPPRNVPGMRTVQVDITGRLKSLEVLPTQDHASPPANASAAADFSEIFKLAGLNIGDFSKTDPALTPTMYADHRYAWRGYYPENPGQTIQVEAASYEGRPVFFQIIEPWRKEADRLGIDPNPDLPTGRNIILQATLILMAVVSGVVLAFHNVRAGHVDGAGAQKVSGLFLILGLLIWLLCANHVPELFLEMRLFFRVLGSILVPATIVWMFYLALEPYVRRIWPETVISWSRVLAGRITDPLVASHVLVGLAVAAAATLVSELGSLAAMLFGKGAALPPNLSLMIRLFSRDNAASQALWSLLDALYVGLLYLLALVLFQLLLRRRWLSAAAFVILVSANTVYWSDAGLAQWLQQIITAAIIAGTVLMLLVRFGLVATLACLWGIYLLRLAPLTSDMSAWYATQTISTIGLLAATSVAAATIATHGWRHRSHRTITVETRPSTMDPAGKT